MLNFDWIFKWENVKEGKFTSFHENLLKLQASYSKFRVKQKKVLFSEVFEEEKSENLALHRTGQETLVETRNCRLVKFLTQATIFTSFTQK